MKGLTFPGILAASLAMAGAADFTVSLTPGQDGGGLRTGSGSGTLTLSGNSVTFHNITFGGLSANSTAAHIHGPAGPGVSAAVLYPLSPTFVAVGSSSGTISGTMNLVDGQGGFSVAQQIGQLNGGLWYINVHSTTFPGGEIRGQILPAPPPQPGLVISDFSPSTGALLDIVGAGNASIRVEGSADMGSWAILNTLALDGNGTAQWTDPGAGALTKRFYRAVDTTSTLVYSTNVAAFVRITAPPGFALIANPLLPADATLGAMLPVLADGVSIFKVGTVGYIADNFLNGWSDPNLTVVPGEGIMIRNPFSTNLVLTFKGAVLQGSLTNKVPAGFSLLSSIVPQSGALDTQLGYPADDGDSVYFFSPTTQSYEVYTFISGFGWLPTTPVPVIGQSFWVQSSIATDWTRTFSATDTGFGAYAVAPIPATNQTAQVNFFTYNPSAAFGRVLDLDTVTPLSNGYVAQLYAGTAANENALVAVGSPAGFSSGSGAGDVNAGSVSIPGASGLQTVYVQLRAWETALGASYESAVANGSKAGKSAIISLTAGAANTGSGIGPLPPAVNGFSSFSLVSHATLPAINTQPQSASLVAGGTTGFSVTATGTPAPNYQWFFNGTNAVAAGTNSTLSLFNVQLSQAGGYYVVASNAAGSVTSVVATLTVLPAALASAAYDPSLGTLPEAQGFIAVNNGIAPSPTVMGGLLQQNTSGNNSARQWWYSSQAENGTVFNFSDGFLLEATLKVITSGYNPDIGGGRPRAGYALEAVDNTGRYLGLNLTSDGLWLDTSGDNLPGSFTAFAPFDSTSGFNNYRLVTQGNTATLFINGSPFLSISLGTLDTGDRAVVTFGENTAFAGSQTELAFFRFIRAIPACLPPPAGLVAWWPGEDNAMDVAGTIHGVLTNGVSFSAGRVGRGFHFGGVSGELFIAASPTLAVGTNGGFSIGAWIAPEDLSIAYPIFEWADTNGTIGVHLWLSSPVAGGGPGSVFANLADRAGFYHYFSTAPGVVPTNGFHYVALSYNSISGEAFISVDAVIAAFQNVGAFAPETRFNLHCGAGYPRGAGFGTHFVGTLDEITLYDRPLGSNEIAAIYAAGSAGICKPAPLAAGVRGRGGILRSPEKPNYDYGESVTLTATNARYYQFVGWSDGVTSSNRTVIAGTTNNLVALFTNTVPLETLAFQQWDRSFGGLDFDNYPIVRQTPDGGYVLAGATASGVGGNKTTPLCGAVAAWIVKLDADGNKQWEQTVGAPGSALYIVTIEPTSDGGYALGASSTAGISAVTDNCGKTSPNFGAEDFWVVRLDASGQRLWDASYGGTGSDALGAMSALGDGGFILVGNSASGVSGNKTSPNFGGKDFWVVRVDASGNKLWDRSFGGSDGESAFAVAVMADGGFLVSGGSSSGIGGNKTAPNYGLQDYWVVRLDAGGNKLWDQSYGGSSDDFGAWLTPTPDGGAVLAGYTDSPVGGTRTAPNRGGSDYWVVRIDANGNQMWDRSFGGSGLYDWSYGARAAADGGVIVFGESDSGADGNKTSPQFGNSDGWVVRLDPYGEKVADYSLGGSDYDYIWSADRAGADAFVLAGGSVSDPSGNKTAPHFGGEDFWLVKMLERIAPVGTPVILVNGQYSPSNAVSHSGFSPVSVQLQSSFAGGTLFYTLNGAYPGSGQLYTGPFNLSDSAVIRAIAYNADFTEFAESDPVTITLSTPPAILSPPLSQVAVSNATVAFAVSAIGTAPLSFQWLFNNSPLIGKTSASLTLPNARPADAGDYRVIVTNPYGSSTSTVATLTVLLPPGISQQPLDTAVNLNDPVTFTVSATGTPPLLFQWRKNGVNIPGATSSSLTINNVQPADAGSYSVVVANAAGAVTSDPAVLTIQGLPTGPPAEDFFANRNTLSGSLGSLEVNNFGATREPGEPDHAGKPGGASVWYRWSAPANGIATIQTGGSSFDTLLAVYTGLNVSNLTFVASDEDDGGFLTSLVRFNALAGTEYEIAVDGYAGAQGKFILSWSLEATPQVLPVITSQPQSQTVPSGSNAIFAVTATGSGLTYQWFFNGAPISGANNFSYTRPAVGKADAGYYAVAVTNSLGRGVLSSAAALEVGLLAGLRSADKLQDLLPVPSPGPARGALAALVTPIIVTAGSTASQILNSTNSFTQAGESNHCGVIGGASRWFKFTAGADGLFAIDTSGSGFDTVLAVYTGSDALSLQLLDCNNDAAPGVSWSAIKFSATSGIDYLVAVDGVNGAQGVVQLNWCLGLPPGTGLTAPAPLLIREGQGALLTAPVTSAVPVPQFQWRLNNLDLANQTNATLQLNNLQALNGGLYSVVVSNCLGAVTSLVAQVRIEVPLHLSSSLTRDPSGLHFRIDGLASQGFVVEWTTNLINWIPLATNPVPNTPFNFLDSSPFVSPFRFFRAMPWP